MTPLQHVTSEESNASPQPSTTLRVTRTGLTWVGPRSEDAQVVDVEIDGARIWSARMPGPARSGRRRLDWPRVLRRWLGGRGIAVVRDQSTGAAIAEGAFLFPPVPGRSALADIVSAGLVVDKWGKLVRAASASLHRDLLAGLDLVLRDLTDSGFDASITGGTLLGAIRSGAILERDDDVDVMVYLGERHPSDVVIASYDIERALVSRGHRIIRHSDAHLQILVGPSGGHVDVFLGFHHRGEYHQPIAVRGRFEVDQLLPFGTATLHGREYPAVADPEGWLELCYGPGWRTPDPSFRFHTPASTRRRFENWFGVYDLNRHFWEEVAARRAPRTAWHPDVDLLMAESDGAGPVIDLGCGHGELAALLVGAGRRVIAVDYAVAAIVATEECASDRLSARRISLADRRALLGLATDELGRGHQVDALLSDVLAYLTGPVRRNVYALLRTLLGNGGVAIASFPVNPSIRYDHHRPDTWHLPIAWLIRESKPFGLDIEVRGFDFRRTSSGRRLIATVAVRRRSAGGTESALHDTKEHHG